MYALYISLDDNHNPYHVVANLTTQKAWAINIGVLPAMDESHWWYFTTIEEHVKDHITTTDTWEEMVEVIEGIRLLV